MPARTTWFNLLQNPARILSAVILCGSFHAHAALPPSTTDTKAGPLKIDGLGKGFVPLDGPWQFHLGDDPAWAAPGIDDTTGHNGWEQLTADKPWGLQGHASYTGYAWYRRRIEITPAPGASPDVALILRGISDVYELYWNGVPVGHLGSFPPHLNWFTLFPQSYGLGPVRSGVLAVRVFKVPLSSVDDGTAGGFQGPPIVGSPTAIAILKDAGTFHWLRSQQFYFGLTSLYGLTSLLSLIAWLRDRRQWLLFWMTIFTFMHVLEASLGLGIPISMSWLTFVGQVAIELREVAQWFVLLWLLQLNVYPRLHHLTRTAAAIAITSGSLVGLLSFLYPSLLSAHQFQIADATLTAFILPLEAVPILLVAFAVVRRQRLDSARWLVAGFALISGAYFSVQNIVAQGSRFTHWTLAAKMVAPQFILFGSVIFMQTILGTLLFLSIVYAVIRYSIDNQRRQTALEQEFQNARELQQILVPETLPAIPGFTLTSAYKPAQEVGGDFFQIIPLEGSMEGSTLIVLGDVSGKGLKAAMTVSLIVGAVRTLAKYDPQPAQFLAEVNQRLHGRMQGGFTTCIALLLNPDGSCILSSAGHPAPFLNQREIDLPGALPLGLVAGTNYPETRLQLHEGDHFSLYTDGLLEARNDSGELYGFDRLAILFGSRPNASQISEEAVAFGQEDDVTVLTLTRLAYGQQSTTHLSAPSLVPA